MRKVAPKSPGEQPRGPGKAGHDADGAGGRFAEEPCSVQPRGICFCYFGSFHLLKKYVICSSGFQGESITTGKMVILLKGLSKWRFPDGVAYSQLVLEGRVPFGR